MNKINKKLRKIGFLGLIGPIGSFIKGVFVKPFKKKEVKEEKLPVLNHS